MRDMIKERLKEKFGEKWEEKWDLVRYMVKKEPSVEEEFSSEDLEYMSSLNAAVRVKSSASSKIILWSVFLLFGWFILWSSIAEIDELTRGFGKIIPSSQIQVVQNLEGGIISEILVREGATVEKGQPLLKINNVGFASSYEESKIKLHELKARRLRLEAEAFNRPMQNDPLLQEEAPRILQNELSLYESNKRQLESKLAALDELIKQKENELEEAKGLVSQLTESVKIVQREIAITQPLVKKGVVSEVEFLKLKREANEMEGKLKSSKLAIPKNQSIIEEAKRKKEEEFLNFTNTSKKELNAVTAEIERIEENKFALEDKVSRTMVRSPVAGTIKQILVNTIGGVIRPGMDLIEIVPTEDTLQAEVKIKPSDIAFIYPGQKAMVKFTAYDFTIHGGLEGRVKQVSADTITDEEGESYYLVRIETDKNYLGEKENPLRIMVGMTVNVDILTGKKTILQYILKPILRAKENALRER